MRPIIIIAISYGLTFGLSSSTFAAPMFQGLGALPGAPYSPMSALSQGLDVSGDGQAVVGLAQNADGNLEAFRWTASEGMTGLGDLPGGSFASVARAASADGSVVVGESTGAGGETRAFRWTEIEGMVPLANLSGSDQSRARGVSADGSVVVGETFFSGAREPTKWTNGVPSPLGVDIAEGFARAVSADGSIVVGESSADSTPSVQVTQWVGSLEIRMGVEGTAYGISADGSTVVGTAYFTQFSEAFMWTDDQFTPLGFLDDTDPNPYSRASDASADGSIIVGFSDTRVGGSDDNAAFIWDAENGMRSLEDVLVNELGLDLTGWKLNQGNQYISDNGRVIVGSGLNPDGFEEAWIAVIPEPSTGLLLGFGLLALSASKRRY